MAAAAADWARTTSRIVVASADPAVRQRVLRAPELLGAECWEASGGAQALAKLREGVCDVVWLDHHLGDLDSSEVAELIRRRHPGVGVCWIERHEDECDNADLSGGFSRPTSGSRSRSSEDFAALPGMIGESAVMREVYRLARLVAERDTTVLIAGETGTGKELVAQGVHKLSCRADAPFVVVNCAAIPESLLEAELFGHAKGAYTGAVQPRSGRIQSAEGGTLFLDEIGELPLAMQAKLLRFLQSGEVQRLGSTDTQTLDVRVICATNAQLETLVEQKQFRADLYYRLAVFPIVLPPLRERCGDIPLLSRHFLRWLGTAVPNGEKMIGESAAEHLERRPWPGNVRELQHVLERAFILAGDEFCLTPEHFPCSGIGASAGMV